jgi:hypothetical protein
MASLYRLATDLTVTTMLGIGLPAAARAAAEAPRPGKFARVDRSTTDPGAVPKFYRGLFGGTAVTE